MPTDPVGWYLANRPVLFGFIRAIVPRDVAEDALQETFLAVQRSSDRFMAGADAGAWVRGIARNVAKQTMARQGRLQALPMDELIDRFDQAAGELEATATGFQPDAVARLRACTDRLPAAQRALLARRYHEGLSLAELAEATGRSAGAVQVALSRLRSALAECIGRATRAAAT